MILNVIVLAAGRGTRMGQTLVPKVLMPYRGRAIISHTIEAWLVNDYVRFFVVVQEDTSVEDYLTQAYPNLLTNFVRIPKALIDSGPIFQTKMAVETIRIMSYPVPEMIVMTVADGVYARERVAQVVNEQKVLPAFDRYPLLGTTAVSNAESKDYLMASWHPTFSCVDKPDREVPDHLAWSGVLIYDDLRCLHHCLDKLYPSGPDALVTYETFLTQTYKEYGLGSFELPFLDLGTRNRYSKATDVEGYDYSKEDLITYTDHSSGRVVKYFDNCVESVLFVKRGQNLMKAGAQYLFPRGIRRSGHFAGYDYIQGASVSSLSRIDIKYILDVMYRQLWALTPENQKSVTQVAPKHTAAFLLQKTRNRVEEFLNRPEERETTHGWLHLLGQELWTDPGLSRLAVVHGDLTLDNIISDGESRLYLIDWRPTIVSASALADVYYDLAKLWISIEIDLFSVREGHFSDTRMPVHNDKDQMLSEFEDWCVKHDFVYKEVVRKAILIMASMCGVHKPPFARAIYMHSLGLANMFSCPSSL